MSNKKREGGFYASKVRLFLNEYGGVNLEKFCKVEGVSYTKMCNCLRHPSYREPSSAMSESTTDSGEMLPGMELKPLVIDLPARETPEIIKQSSALSARPVKPQPVLSGVVLRMSLSETAPCEVSRSC